MSMKVARSPSLVSTVMNKAITRGNIPERKRKELDVKLTAPM